MVNSLQNRINSITLCITLNAKTGKIVLVTLCIQIEWLFCNVLDPQNAPKSLAAGASPQTPLGELTALPMPPSWIQGVLLLREGEERGAEQPIQNAATTPTMFIIVIDPALPLSL